MGFADFDIYYRANLVWLDMLFECKYHEEDRKWVFVAFEQPEDFSLRVSTENIFIDFPWAKRLPEYGYHQKYRKKEYTELHGKFSEEYFPKSLPVVHKGVEIYKNGFNPKSVTESIFQLLFALGKAIVTDIENLCDPEDEYKQADDDVTYFDGYLACVIIPIIVTTAQLYVLNESVTLEDVKDAKAMEDVAKPAKAIFYEQNAPLDLQDYIKKSFTIQDRLLKSGFFSTENIEELIVRYSQIDPRILIIGYDYLEETMKSLMDEMNGYFRNLNKYWSRKTRRRRKKTKRQ
jgi:hypothetical protein